MTGRVVAMEEVPDPVFAEKMLGDGLAIDPTDGLGVAPISGKLVVFHSAGHAFVVETPDGVQVAVHLGLDTVTLKGAPFERLAEQGDTVAAGQPIVRMDLAAVAGAGLSCLSPIFLPQLDESWTLLKTPDTSVRAGQPGFLAIEREGAEAAAAGAVESGSEAAADVVIRNPTGLHARPAAVFVREAARFKSTLTIQNRDTAQPPVDAKGLVALLGAGLARGTNARLTARGEDAAEAIAALSRLVEVGLVEWEEAQHAASARPAFPPRVAGGERRASRTPAGTHASLHVKAVAAAPGIAIGPVWRYPARAAEGAGAVEGSASPSPPEAAGADAIVALRSAARTAAEQLEALAARVTAAGRPDDAGILDAQSLVAADPALLDEAARRLAEGASPVAAITEAAAASAERLAALDDELLAARAADIRDVGARIARILLGEQLDLPERPSIAVADDLPPSITAEIPAGFLLGVALAGGSRTAHAVILARGLGIPCVVGATGLMDAVDRSLDAVSAASGRGGELGQPEPPDIAVDGIDGEVIIDPTDEEVDAIESRQKDLTERARRAALLRDRPAATADGERVAVVANIGSPEDAPRALDARAEGVGLFRTEFLYMKRQTPPTEHEQVTAYRRVLTAFGPDRPVVIRLADIGGDKGIPYLGLPAEANPFLGVRAIRLAYGSHDLLRTQLRAIWQAGALAGVTPHVMAPMVATVADVRLLEQLREEARDDVRSAGLACAEKMVTGIMVEIPSAALLAAELAPLIDFFSIGTNDLTQYTMAADRGNATLSSLQDALHPAVLRLIAGVVRGADAAGIPVAVCGELAGEPAGALVLVGLGVDELSADAGSLDGVRAALAAVTRAELNELAAGALAATDAEAVRALAQPYLARSAG